MITNTANISCKYNLVGMAALNNFQDHVMNFSAFDIEEQKRISKDNKET